MIKLFIGTIPGVRDRMLVVSSIDSSILSVSSWVAVEGQSTRRVSRRGKARLPSELRELRSDKESLAGYIKRINTPRPRVRQVSELT